MKDSHSLYKSKKAITSFLFLKVINHLAAVAWNILEMQIYVLLELLAGNHMECNSLNV